MSNDVYIIGIDMIKFGRFPDKSVPELAAESILLALDDANLTMNDMQAFYCGNIKEVNRFKDTMINGAKNLTALLLNMNLCRI